MYITLSFDGSHFEKWLPLWQPSLNIMQTCKYYFLGCVHTESELAKWRQARRSEAAKQKQTEANSGLSTITNTAYVPCRKYLLKLVKRQDKYH